MYLREFTGGVFSERIEGGRAGATVELSQTEVTAITPDGQRFSLPYSKCQISIGGESGRTVFCRTEDRSLSIFCDHKEFGDALSVASFGQFDEELRQGLRNLRRERRVDRRLWFSLFVILVGSLVVGYYGLLWASHAALHALPISFDQELGQRVFHALNLGRDEIKDVGIVEPLQKIVDRLAPHAAVEGFTFVVYVVESPQLNAFALPGGTIVVYTGLIEAAERPEQIAGVLGHEMAHVTLRHGLERIGKITGLSLAVKVLLGDVQGVIMAGTELFQLATISSYSRIQENAADHEGVRMLYEAGVDPTGLAQFFETLHEEHGNVPGIIAWLDSHPQDKERIAAVKAQLAELPPKKFEPLDIDLDEIKKLIKEQ
jgi:Zn-dependent protease with chaperone function